MLLAIAALFLNLGPQVEALPLAAVPAAIAVAEPSPTPDPTPDVDVAHNTEAAPPDSLPVSASTEPAKGVSSNAATPHVLHAAVVGVAQNSQSLSTIRIPDATQPKNSGIISAERMPSRRNWLLLGFAQHGAAAFDAYSTRLAISQGATEQDPLMKPFANSSAIYAAIQVAPLACDYMARHMQRSPNNFIRRIWWMPQSVGTASFLLSGVHNERVAH